MLLGAPEGELILVGVSSRGTPTLGPAATEADPIAGSLLSGVGLLVQTCFTASVLALKAVQQEMIRLG